MTTDTDKLVALLRECGAEEAVTGLFYVTVKDIAAFAAAHVASLCAGVEQDGFRLVSVNAGFTELMEALDRADRKGYMPDAIYSAYEGFQYRDPASTVASLTAQRDQALARVAELEKDAARGRLLLKWLWSGHIPGPAWGRPIKLVETCPQFGDETEVKNIEALLDAALTKGQP